MVKISFVFISCRGVALTTHPSLSPSWPRGLFWREHFFFFFPPLCSWDWLECRVVDQPSGKVSHVFRLAWQTIVIVSLGMQHRLRRWRNVVKERTQSSGHLADCFQNNSVLTLSLRTCGIANSNREAPAASGVDLMPYRGVGEVAAMSVFTQVHCNENRSSRRIDRSHFCFWHLCISSLDKYVRLL